MTTLISMKYECEIARLKSELIAAKDEATYYRGLVDTLLRQREVAHD